MSKGKHNPNKVSVRLTDENLKLLNNAKAHGYTTSQFINQSIAGAVISDQNLPRKICPHLCILQDCISNIEDLQLQNEIKQEVNAIWRALK